MVNKIAMLVSRVKGQRVAALCCNLGGTADYPSHICGAVFYFLLGKGDENEGTGKSL